MEYLQMILAIGILFLFAIVGCQTPVQPIVSHKLTVTGNQHAVPLYPMSRPTCILRAKNRKAEWWELSVT